MKIYIRTLVLVSSIILVSSIPSTYNLVHKYVFMDPESTSLLAFGETNTSARVNIPKGAANPEVDITKLTPTQWYVPSRISVNSNDSVTWVNNDTEIHTVTSGSGAGLESLMNNKQGKKDGLFDSGIFKPNSSWAYKFTESGVYSYFCTIHPWMEGTVLVRNTVENIPGYPVDSAGRKQVVFPVHTLTNDNQYDIDMAWSPKAIVTGKPISFILDFSDPVTNKRLHLLPYELVIFQNGKEIARKPGLSQVGSDTQEFTFDRAGPVYLKVTNVGDRRSNSDFNSTVYYNPNITDVKQKSTAGLKLPTNPFKVSTLTLVWITYTIIAVIPAAVAVAYFLYRKRII
jgi:plastocyanin